MKYWYIETDNITMVIVIRKDEYRYLFIDIKSKASGEKVRTLSPNDANPWRVLFPNTTNQWRRKNGGKEYKTFAKLIEEHPNVFLDLL